MFMEAVILSLKDLEMRHPQQQTEQLEGTPDSFKSLQKVDNLDVTSPTEHLELAKTESTSSSALVNKSQEPKHPPLDSREPSAGPASDTSPSVTESGSTEASSFSDTSKSGQTSSESDLSAKTKATLTVERNPTSHVMDGLMRRWDFNFFRNNSNR